MFQICYSGIRDIPEKLTCQKVTSQIISEKQFRSKFKKVAKVAGCKITARVNIDRGKTLLAERSTKKMFFFKNDVEKTCNRYIFFV